MKKIIVIALFVLVGFAASAIAAEEKDCELPLVRAIMRGEKRALTLISATKDINKANCFGYTPLISAVISGRYDLVGHILDAGADINKSSPKTGYTPLMFALINGKYGLIRMLAMAGADINKRSPKIGYTAVMFAVVRGDTKAISMLIDLGADTTIASALGNTPIMIAENNERHEIVKVLSAATETPKNSILARSAGQMSSAKQF